MPNFISFDKASHSMKNAPFVTIQREGKLITLNQPAFELLGSPQFVELSYDSDEQLIGIQATQRENPRHYAVLLQGKAHSIAGRAFTQYWKLDTSLARRYAVSMSENYLVIDMKSGGADATGVRSKYRVT